MLHLIRNDTAYKQRIKKLFADIFIFYLCQLLNRDIIARGWLGGLNLSLRSSAPLEPPKWNDTLYRHLWRAAILSSRQPPPWAPLDGPHLPPPHFEKSGYAAVAEKDDGSTKMKTHKQIIHVHIMSATECLDWTNKSTLIKTVFWTFW